MQAQAICTQISLSFLQGNIVFNSFQNANPLLDTIIFERISTLHDYPSFSSLLTPELSSHLCGLVYDLNMSCPSISSILALEQMLLFAYNTDNTIYMLECSDSDLQSENVYLLVHSQDILGLGCYITGARIGIFKFSYQDLYGPQITPCLPYIKALKISRADQIKQCYTISENIQKKQNDNQFFCFYVEKLKEKIQEEEGHLHMYEKLKETLQVKLENKKKHSEELQEQDLECLICRNSVKSIVFLPCGHVLACKVCVVERMKLDLNKIINSRKRNESCPLCKARVREAREVSFN